MKPSVSYVREKFAAAVEALATGADPLPQRLLGACQSFATLDGPVFPTAEMNAKWKFIHDRLVENEDTGQGRIQATLDAMSADRAAEIARDIVDLEFQVRAHRP